MAAQDMKSKKAMTTGRSDAKGIDTLVEVMQKV